MGYLLIAQSALEQLLTKERLTIVDLFFFANSYYFTCHLLSSVLIAGLVSRIN